MNELTTLLMDAMYDAGEYDLERNTFTARYMAAYPVYEHFAACLVENREQADLRRVIRIAQEELAWRVGLNDEAGPQEVSWTSDGDTATAILTDRKTGRKTTRTMTGSELCREP